MNVVALVVMLWTGDQAVFNLKALFQVDEACHVTAQQFNAAIEKQWIDKGRKPLAYCVALDDVNRI